MSVPKGKSGPEVAKENLAKVEDWVAERNRLRDWHEYEHNGKINRSALADELDFARSVTTQNRAVKKILEEKDRLWFQAEPVIKEAQEASLERSNAALGKASAANNKLIARVAELEAENRELRRENAAYRRMKSMIESGEPGFKL
ncbi:MAG: hypothetical protein N0E59_21255 [Candidatus Thiodiazotropha taylori]|nr:hypothetical protein [Candidatus Thiodiazotropha taylori]MCG8113287.1 hypothetical protein [Candidatus Thiodiazotropha taylori]MCW4285648.1 hypothetical protein [Candidatus Thiodiazotropha taylori]MCW4327737.1 hypothetical protein [Candidatus Thiodiazotropha taylori]